MNRRCWILLVLVFFPVAIRPVASVGADTFTRRSFGDRSYRLFVPASEPSDSRPLLVMLHGCTQSSRQFASETGMNRLAGEEDFLVLYPDQTAAAQRYECWNFYEPAQRTRGSGEAALIRGMVQDVLIRYPVDRRRIYVAGFSGGAGMAVHLGVAYPDVFAAVGVHSGFEYGAADGVAEALTAMEEGGPDPERMGREAYVAMGDRADAVPTIVLHGQEDEIVHPINGRQAARQATQTLDLVGDGVDDDYIDAVPDRVEEGSTAGHRFTRREYRYEDGRLGVVEYRIEGMAHSWSGGSAGGAYVDPDAPEATRIIWTFFNRHTLDRVDAYPYGRTEEQSLEASFEMDRTLVLVNRPVRFRVRAPRKNVEYHWSFGDGRSDTGVEVTHRFDGPGQFRVRMRAIAGDRAADTATRMLTVVE